jgi:hypothetical protein
MNRWLTLPGGFIAITLLSSGLAFGQQPQQPKADCKTPSPQKVEGEVVRVDQTTNKVTIKDKSGSMHEFQSNPATTKDMKPGDQVEARLREAPKC